MPYLGDYLGHLLSEMTIARVQADLETLRVAELYASDPLLKHFPVPHFRLPTVTLEVSVAVKEMEEAEKDVSPRGKVDLSSLLKIFDKLFPAHAKNAGIELTEKTKRNIKRQLGEVILKLKEPSYISISVKHIADEFVSVISKILRENVPEIEGRAKARFEKFTEDLKRELIVEFLSLRTPPPRLHVLVTTAELREAGPPELIPHMTLTVSEEGVEWTVIESEGRYKDRLVPE